MSKVPESRRNVALVISIILGLVIGLFIKKSIYRPADRYRPRLAGERHDHGQKITVA